MPGPLVSVILPCYNVSRRFQLFEQALRSVCTQSYQNLEVIAVNDGSSDDTEARITRHFESLNKDFGSETFRYHALEQNAGPSVARNEGIRQARGEIVSFLDFDDLYLPDYLKTAVTLFESPETTVVLVASLFYKYLFGFEKVSTVKIAEDINSCSFERACGLYLGSNFPIAMGSGVVCRRSMFEANPNTYYDEYLSKRTAEDVMFGYRLLLEGIRPVVTDEQLVIHRTYYGEISRSVGAFLNQDELEVYNYIYEKTMAPVLERIRPMEPELAAIADASVARSRREFTIKHHFLKNNWSALGKLSIQSPRTLRTILRLILLRLSGIPPLSVVRDIYFYLSSHSDPEAKKRTLTCLGAVS